MIATYREKERKVGRVVTRPAILPRGLEALAREGLATVKSNHLWKRGPEDQRQRPYRRLLSE